MELAGQPCIVIGGGQVAEGKVLSLVEAGGIVTVVSPVVSAGLKALTDSGNVRHVPREYEYGDLAGNLLAYVATGDASAEAHAAAEARQRGIPINVADNPHLSSFISSATFRRGALQVAISTGGASPAVARMLCQHLAERIGPQYAVVLEVMRRARRYLRGHESDLKVRARILNSLAAALLASIEEFDDEAVERALRSHLNASMAQLGLPPAGASGAGLMLPTPHE